MFINSIFSYDGISSDTYGIQLVRSEGGLIQGQFGINRSIVKDNIQNNPIPFFFGVEYQPLTFSIQIYYNGIWTSQKKREVAQWLFKDGYKPFYSMDNPEVVYYCMPVDSPEKSFTAMNEGYIEIKFECDAPWAWSPILLVNHDFSNNTGVQFMTLENRSNLVGYKHYPEIEIQLQGNSTEFQLINLTNGGVTTAFTGLDLEEKIYIDNQKKIIKTDKPDTYRYANFNKNWLELTYGQNVIEVFGKCKVKVRSKFPVIE